MSLDGNCNLAIILSKKFEYLEKRVAYLEGKSRGQECTIDELTKKLEDIERKSINQSQDEIHENSSDRLDVKPDINFLLELSDTEQTETQDKDSNLSDKIVSVNEISSRKPKVQKGCEFPPGNTIIPEHEINLKFQKCKKNYSPPLKWEYHKPPLSKRIYNLLKNTKKSDKICEKFNKKTLAAPKSLRIKQEKTQKKIKKSNSSFICEFCSKSFRNSSHLKTHLRIHTGEKPFNCTECPKSFNQLVSMQKHLRFHSGERPFLCSVCAKQFSSSSQLKRHSLIHSGLKPHKCQICSKSFSQKSHFDEHLRIHSGEKPFECSTCQEKFRHRANLNKHIKKENH